MPKLASQASNDRAPFLVFRIGHRNPAVVLEVFPNVGLWAWINSVVDCGTITQPTGPPAVCTRGTNGIVTHRQHR